MLSLPTKIMAGAIVALVLALGVVGWRYTAALKREGAMEQALDTAVRVNQDNAKAMAAAKAEADAERERAIARQRERDNLAGQMTALRQRLSNASGACDLPADVLNDIDRCLRGQCP